MTGAHVPFSYWPEPTKQRTVDALAAKGEVAAERIRLAARAPACSCAREGERAGDGRCSRCWGWPF